MKKRMAGQWVYYMGVGILALYTACIFADLNTDLGLKNLVIPLVLTALALFVPILYVTRWLSSKELSETLFSYTNQKRIGIGTALFSFLLLMVWWLAYIPGGYNSDCILQWDYVQTGIYSDWHPVLHTLLFYTLPTRIYNHPGTVVVFQILCFSLAAGYLMFNMAKYGCGHVFLLITFFYVTCNPATLSLMMTPWKDCALSIMLILLTTQTINLHFTGGRWMCKRLNRIFLAAVLAVSCTLRHNAILYVGIFLLLMIALWKDYIKSVVKIIVLTVLFIVLIKGPLYGCFEVHQPGNRVAEMSGTPMNILANVVVNDPEALSEEASVFLHTIASQEQWESLYKLGNYNNVKWNVKASRVVEEYGITKILIYTMEAFHNSPLFALEALIATTDVAWDIGEGVDYVLYPETNVDPQKIPYTGISILRTVEDGIIYISTQNIFGILFWDTGLWIYILLLAAASRVYKGNSKKIFYIFPLLIYNFGTMLFISGDDAFRFFYFTRCVALPLLFILMKEEKMAVLVKEDKKW